MKFLSFVLVADARIKALDGDYKGALERCLMTGTFAHHVGDDTLISYLVSLAVRDLGYKCMQDIIGQAGSDTKLLQWLRTELAISSIDSLSLTRPLKTELEIVTDLVQMKNIKKLARVMIDSDDKKMAEIISKANENILKQNLRLYSERMRRGLTIMSTPMPYEKAHSQLKQLANDFDSNDRSSQIAGTFMPALARISTLKTRTETHANAIKTAILVLLRRAKTGQLPDALPAGLPGDLFSGKDFKYEKTKNGFTLHCQGKDLDKNEIYKYEFKVKK